jgi:hypothetical protein
MRHAAFLLLFVLAFVGYANAGDLVGQVFQGKAPLRNQSISLAGPTNVQATTNASGFYAFRNLREGEYTVTILGHSEKVYVFSTGETQKDIHF